MLPDLLPPDVRLLVGDDRDGSLLADSVLPRDVAARVLDVSMPDRLGSTLRLVWMLSVWSETFHASALYDGHVYMASEGSVPRLARVCRTKDAVLCDEVEVESLLQGLFDDELVYRFPVALKFRGQFGSARQFRLNCWGRRLARRLRTSAWLAEHDAEQVAAIGSHLSFHREQYGQHMRLLSELDRHHVGAAWASAEQLPVGVLV